MRRRRHAVHGQRVLRPTRMRTERDHTLTTSAADRQTLSARLQVLSGSDIRMPQGYCVISVLNCYFTSNSQYYAML